MKEPVGERRRLVLAAGVAALKTNLLFGIGILSGLLILGFSLPLTFRIFFFFFATAAKKPFFKAYFPQLGKILSKCTNSCFVNSVLPWGLECIQSFLHFMLYLKRDNSVIMWLF